MWHALIGATSQKLSRFPSTLGDFSATLRGSAAGADASRRATMPAWSSPSLVADCSQLLRRCAACCCRSRAASGFGVDKPGGTPCPNLAGDDRCRIHATLREDGWPGCTVFDCFGAGQQVSQVTYGGVSWREQDNLGEMAAVLSVMRLLHEMLAHLTRGRAPQRRTPAARPLADRGRRA